MARANRGSATPSIAVLEALALDKTITPNALRVGILHELGWTAAYIRAELKMPKQTWSDAVRKLGQRPRSARSENSDVPRTARVRKLGQRPRSGDIDT